MSHCTIAQLAEIRRQELISDATAYWPARIHSTHTSARSRRHSRWAALTAFRDWVAAGQL